MSGIAIKYTLIDIVVYDYIPFPIFPSVLLISVFPTNVLYAFLSLTIRVICPANPILLYLIALIILGEDCKLNITNISHKVCTTKC